MNNFIQQSDSNHIYEISTPVVAYRSPRVSSDEIFSLVLATALTSVLWAWLWWHVIGKIGYQGLTRKLWLVTMCTPLCPGTMVLLLVLPWPVHRRLRKQVKVGQEMEAELQQYRQMLTSQEIFDYELDQMRR